MSINLFQPRPHMFLVANARYDPKLLPSSTHSNLLRKCLLARLLAAPEVPYLMSIVSPHDRRPSSHLDLSFRQYAASLPVFIQVPNNSFILHTIIQKLRELNDAILISINFINLHPYSCPSSQAFHILAQTSTSRDHGRMDGYDGWGK